jgi:hypothetical protein
MDGLNWEEEREKRREESLKRHAGLHRLFKEDRLGFEREKKRLLDEFFATVHDEEERKRLKALQDSWNSRMRHAGSEHNRLVLAQTFFWDHFHKNWQPAIQRLNLILNGTSE